MFGEAALMLMPEVGRLASVSSHSDAKMGYLQPDKACYMPITPS